MRTVAVIGAGIAGLAAARALSSRVESVVIVERDGLGVSRPRRGVGQASHLHVLLQRGRRELEALFPGLDADLAGEGAPEIDWSADTAWLTRHGWLPRGPSRVRTRSCSRDLLERKLRERVLALPNVRVEEGLDVTEAIPGERGRIAGVRGAGREVRADLVVDASGRSSRLSPGRLTQSIDASVGYASRLMRVPAASLGGFKQLYVQMRPPESARGGVLTPIEGGLYRVTLVGAAGDHPPADEPGFMAFAASLHDPAFHELVRQAEPAGPISTYRRTASRRLGAALGPCNLLHLGDSYCAFNPVYGQGMTVAALSARALGECLDAGHVTAAGFERRLARAVLVPWMLGSSEDFRVPGRWLQGLGARDHALFSALPAVTDRVIRKAVTSPSTHLRFLEVLHMMSPPTALMGAFLGGRS